MKIGVFTSNGGFLAPVLKAMKKRNHEVLIWPNTTTMALNWINLQRLLDRVDVAFFEWCQYPFPEAMMIRYPKCKIVLREHGLPFFDTYKVFPWNNVDLFIGASELFGEKLKELPPDRQPKRYVDIPVGSDPAFFTIPKHKIYGHNLLMHSAIIRFKKRVYTTLETFYDLLKHDRSWDLHIVGNWSPVLAGPQAPGWEGVQYTGPCQELIEDLDLAAKVHLSPHMDVKDWRSCLGAMDLFISNSIREGVQISLIEAMLSGIHPFVHAWRGAEAYYPKECIFKTQRELVDKIIEWGKLDELNKRALSQSAREWVVERFDNDVLMERLMDELEAL